MRRPRSLAGRLAALVALWSLIALAGGGAALSWAFRDAVQTAFDARLSAMLLALVAAVDETADGELVLSRPLGDPRFEQIYSGWYWQITSDDGAMVVSRSLWDARLPVAAADGVMTVRDGVGPRGEVLRIAARDIALPGEGAATQVLIAAEISEITAETRRLDLLLTTSLGALGIVSAGLAWLVAGLGLAPLRRLESQMAEILAGRRERLDAPAPAELASLADGVNALLDHDADLMRRARAAAGDLAHAVRTPLALLRADLADAPGAPAGALANLADVDRAVSRALARASAVARSRAPGARTAIAPVLRRVAATTARMAAERKVAVDVATPPDVAVAADGEDVAEMVGNLAENAAKWAARMVCLSAARQGGQILIMVEDDGPGIPKADRDRVLARGVRLDATIPGSGLGLAIAADLAELCGGSIALDASPLGGLAARLTLPAAP